MSEKPGNRFYVYIHRRNDTNEVFYVGKGSGNRVLKRGCRNDWWKHIVAKHGFTYEIIEQGMYEDEAFDLEVETIKFYRDCGHPLVNCTNGGEGQSGRTQSEQVRAKISSAKKSLWKSLARREKQALHRNRPVICSNGMTFISLLEAKRWVNSQGLSRSTERDTRAISNCCKGLTKFAHKLVWKFVDNDTGTVDQSTFSGELNGCPIPAHAETYADYWRDATTTDISTEELV